jgi:hypothetical protein
MRAIIILPHIYKGQYIADDHLLNVYSIQGNLPNNFYKSFPLLSGNFTFSLRKLAFDEQARQIKGNIQTRTTNIRLIHIQKNYPNQQLVAKNK